MLSFQVAPADVKIRLIDYGNELIIPATALRAPLLLMKNLRRFAFHIEIQNLARPLEVNERLRVKVVRSEEDRKVVEIEEEPSNHHLLDLLGNGAEKVGSGGIITIFTPRTSLVMLSSAAMRPLMKTLYSQLLEVAPKFQCMKNPKKGDLVCIDCFGVGWSRGLIIGQHDKNHIIYTVDNGTVEVVSEEQNIRALPAEYMSKPYLVLQMDICKVVMNEQEFRRLCYMNSFAFNYERHGYNKECRTMRGIMFDAEGKRLLAEVEFSEFKCDLKQVGIRYWSPIPQDKCTVRITSVLNANTVIVCQKDKINVYTEMMQTILPSLKQLDALPSVDDVVVGVDDIMMPFRALVSQIVSNNEIELLDLDNGCIKNVIFGKMYHVDSFISNLPVHTMKVQIRDLNVSALKHSEIVQQQLESFKMDKRNLKLLLDEGSHSHAVKLIDVTTNRPLATVLMEHYNKKLREADDAAAKMREQEAALQKAAAAEAQAKAELKRLEEEKILAQVCQERKAALESSSKATAGDKFTINDLKLIELPVGSNDVKLTILDDGDAQQGALTVCELNDENGKRYATLSEEVNRHAVKIGGDGYCPE